MVLWRRKRERKERPVISVEPTVLCAALPMPVCIDLARKHGR